MARRVAIFAIVWAYTVNALWVPGGLDSYYGISALFPAYYYFLVGGLIALLHENLVAKSPRALAVAALCALLLETAAWMFGDLLTGAYLGACFLTGTILASLASRREFKIHRAFFYLVTLSAFFSLCNDLASTVLSMCYFELDKSASVSKSYRCYLVPDQDTGATNAFVTPRHTILLWFGYKACPAGDAPKTTEWRSNTDLHITAEDSGQSHYNTLNITWSKPPPTTIYAQGSVGFRK
ncbi:MAG: hypothetical protein QM758_00665 [Armatimonas sp.]